MFTKNATNIDIHLNSSIITERVSAKILTSTIECLIYMTNQIPFPYETFQQMINKFKKIDTNNDENDWNNFLLNKKRSLAVETFDKLNLLLKVCIIFFIVEWNMKSACVYLFIFYHRILSDNLKLMKLIRHCYYLVQHCIHRKKHFLLSYHK